MFDRGMRNPMYSKLYSRRFCPFLEQNLFGNLQWRRSILCRIPSRSVAPRGHPPESPLCDDASYEIPPLMATMADVL